ncbi:MAG: hypothetical protein MJZ21_05490 [archaeon]|nr:hypothetical protein [archaeon]
MAKKRRLIQEEPEEEYQFTPTDFDEREFLLKGIYSTRVTIIAIILAVLVGIVNAFIYSQVADKTIVAVVDTIIVFAVVGFMKKILMAIRVRADLLETKTMLGIYLIFLILALGTCVMFINAPFPFA